MSSLTLQFKESDRLNKTSITDKSSTCNFKYQESNSVANYDSNQSTQTSGLNDSSSQISTFSTPSATNEDEAHNRTNTSTTYEISRNLETVSTEAYARCGLSSQEFNTEGQMNHTERNNYSDNGHYSNHTVQIYDTTNNSYYESEDNYKNYISNESEDNRYSAHDDENDYSDGYNDNDEHYYE